MTLPQLDELDRRLIAVLQEDASLTNQALAERVFASPPTCLRRVRRLRDLGVIRRIVADIDETLLGPQLEVIVEVTLDRQDSEAIQRFAERMAGESCVRRCHQVSPGPDFVLLVAIADMPAYHAASTRMFASDANVRNIRAFFAVNCVKSD